MAKAKLGRPTEFNDALKEKMLGLFAAGKTDDQVAEIVGVCPRTIANWKGKHKDFMQALKESKQIADDLVEASLFSRAVGYSHPEEKIFCQEGQIVTHETVKHYPPDTQAAILWLKNRQPERWREKMVGEDDKTVKHEGSIKIESVELEDRIKQLKGEKK